MFSGMTTYLLHDIIKGKMLGKVTLGRKKIKLFHDMMGEIMES